MAPHLILDGYWEPWITNMIQKMVLPGSTIIDIGANVGYYSLIMASLTGEQGKVYSFEANPRTFDLLQKSIAINGFSSRILAEQRAVYSHSGTLTFHCYEREQGGSSINQPTCSEPYSTIEVSAISLDERFDGQRIDLIKMDAEGAELAILKGARKLLQANPQINIVTEINKGALESAGHSVAKLLQFAAEQGFSPLLIATDGTLKEVDAPELERLGVSDIILARD
ncbi:FkbM family methyltransferase [Burkholderiaceae bacterium DAT-1]|nr:FkbM family methyltransferase [Burkholderiaceae bacterium DAT-1]